MTEPHPLLERLLLKVGATTGEAPSNEAWRNLLGFVSRTYHENDQDRYTLERSIDISSREMQQLYSDLKRQTAWALEIQRQRVEESDAILRATLEATKDAMIVVDDSRRVIVWNTRFVEMFGLTNELMETRDFRRITREVVKRYVNTGTARAAIERMHSGREVSHDELQTVEGRVLDRYSAPVTLPDGQAVGRVTYLRDVTDERTAIQAIELARQAAEAASHAKSMFLANMSHELRTPLNAVIGLADLLLIDGGDPLTKRQKKYLEGIVQSGRHLLAMVNDVLDLAKIEAGKQELELEDIATPETIAEAVGLMQPLAVNRGVELSARVGADVPRIKADPIRLRQILYNLISNAVKFTDRGGVVKVLCETEDQCVAIRVIDTGIGIAPDDIQRLFRAFEQVYLASGDRPSGTGLGLALTKRLVDMHGGTIDVASKVGSGSTFTVRLPVS